MIKFEVEQTEETVNRTFRFPKSVLEEMSALAQNDGISLNSFVVQSCQFALKHHQPKK